MVMDKPKKNINEYENLKLVYSVPPTMKINMYAMCVWNAHKRAHQPTNRRKDEKALKPVIDVIH